MRKILTFGAAAAALTLALPAAAQTTGSDPTGATSSPPSSGSNMDAATPPADTGADTGATSPDAAPESSAAPTGAATNTSATVAVGQSVKDKTGAVIGSVTQVKPDASGKQVATIQMGADTFAVDTSSLAVDNGAAVINATQAEIKGMMKK